MRAISVLPLPLLAVLGAGLGLLLYAIYAPRREVVRINIERCFPELSRRARARLVRRHFAAFGQTALDIWIAWWGSPRRLKRLVSFRGLEHYTAAVSQRRNVILLAPHFIGLEFGGVRLSLDTPLVSVFRHPDNEILRRLIKNGRTRFRARIVPHNKPFTALVRAVKSGMPLYYLPDQDAGRRHAVFAPFFGIPAATFPALARLARMTGAVVIPCVTYQRPWGRGYETVFQPPLAGFPSGDDVADTARMNAEIEKAVRRHPAQYFWLHKRFKTRPQGEGPFYPKARRRRARGG